MINVVMKKEGDVELFAIQGELVIVEVLQVSTKVKYRLEREGARVKVGGE
jgi:hypothetical protein